MAVFLLFAVGCAIETEAQAKPPNQAAVNSNATKTDAKLEAEINKYVSQGLQRRQAHDLRGAEQTFKYAYQLALTSKTNQSYQVKPLEALAGLYRAVGQYELSEALYKKALPIAEKYPGPGNQILAGLNDNLSNVCLDRGKVGEAEQFSKRALAIYEHSDKTTRSDLGKALNQLGMIQTAQKSYSSAEASFKRAIEMLKGSSNPEEQTTLAVAMDNLGSVYLNNGQFDKAEAIRKQAVATCERSAGSANPDLAKCLMNLGAVYGRQNKFEEALPYLKRAEEIDESVLGLRHPTTLQILKNYAVALKLAHRDEELSQLNERLKKATVTTPGASPNGGIAPQGPRLGPQG